VAQQELDRIAAALAAQPDAQHALQLLLTETRRLTRAEAGTVYLREANRLRFAAFQNDVLTRRLGAGEAERRLKGDPLTLTEPSIASYVLLTHGTVNLVDAYAIPLDRPYQFDRRVDVKTGYRTQSMLALPDPGQSRDRDRRACAHQCPERYRRGDSVRHGTPGRR
jgi:GAF domain-containing protein